MEDKLYNLTGDETIKSGGQGGDYRNDLFLGHCSEEGGGGYKAISVEAGSFEKIPTLYRHSSAIADNASPLHSDVPAISSPSGDVQAVSASRNMEPDDTASSESQAVATAKVSQNGAWGKVVGLFS